MIEQKYTDHSGSFHFVMSSDYLVITTITGKNVSIKGTDAFIDVLNRAYDKLEIDKKVRVLADLSELESTPIRIQLLLGRWILTHKHCVGKVAIVGAAKWEKKIAEAVFSVAGISNISFFEQKSEAMSFLSDKVG